MKFNQEKTIGEKDRTSIAKVQVHRRKRTAPRSVNHLGHAMLQQIDAASRLAAARKSPSHKSRATRTRTVAKGSYL
jgi:hypothetical protein